MKHAIRRRVLRTNPLPKGKEATTVTKTSNAVDKRSLMNANQAAALLDWIQRRPRGGTRLHAFFAAVLLRSAAGGGRSRARAGRDAARARRWGPVV
jgi:hypothetical protein